ncbi:MAG: crossover junction endodeoxyribonuclease RuvC [Alphaproteobacteria bacterium]|nr:crossover junction endodeoxyribonuclease RuvC [Alphaproteobacteria bacterium]
MKAILGLDPGLRHTGWAVVVADDRGALSLTASGVIDVPPAKLSMAARLSQLFDALQSTLQPLIFDEAAVEEVFVNKNAKSSLTLGMARGVVMLVPALRGIAVYEYPTNLIKKGLSGFGHADKAQMQQMLRLIIQGADNLRPDAADAAAVALCHLQHRGMQQLY